MAGIVDHRVGPARVVAHGAELVGVAHDAVVAACDHGDGAIEGDVRVLVEQRVARAAGQVVLVLLVAGATGVQRLEPGSDDDCPTPPENPTAAGRWVDVDYP